MINNYKKAFAEVLYIIENLSENNKKKIPTNLIQFMQKNKLENYNVNSPKNALEHEELLSKETKIILTLIYRDYFCSEEERAELDKKILENTKIMEEAKRKKYDTDNIFNNKVDEKKNINEIEVKHEENVELVKYDEVKWYRKIIVLLKKIFFRKNKTN